MIAPGTLVDGKYRVERVLGQGGMGMVLVATHEHLGQRVALKVLLDASEPAAVERFLREGRASAKLGSEHVCRVFDVGQLDTGAPYIVMELLEGEDLAHVIARAPLDTATAAAYVLEACVALVEAHALGIVHRDLKPSNLFLARRIGAPPIVKVLDFGIAKAPNAGDFQITNTTTMLGSPGYMSPEQLRSTRDADARSDIWSLGVILYELVAGRLPFAGETFADLVVKVSIDAPQPLHVADPAYVAVVMRCLDKQPERRYASVSELAHDLAPCAAAAARGLASVIDDVARARTTARDAPIVAATAGTVATVRTTLGSAAGSSAVTSAPRRRSRLVFVGGGVAIAAAAVVATLALVQEPTPGHPPPIAVADAAIARARPDAAVLAIIDVPADAAAQPPIDMYAADVAKCAALQKTKQWTELENCARYLPADRRKPFLEAAYKGEQLAQRDAATKTATALVAAHECDKLVAFVKKQPPALAKELGKLACFPHRECDDVQTWLHDVVEKQGRDDLTALMLVNKVLSCDPVNNAALFAGVGIACRLNRKSDAIMYWHRMGSPRTLGGGCVQ